MLIKKLLILFLLAVFYTGVYAESPIPQEFIVTTADSQKFKLYIFEPDKNNHADSAVITVHGGGWKWGKAEWTFGAARKFANAGMLAVAVDYRLSGDEITPVHALSDICDALKWIRERSNDYSFDPNKVAAYGVSAGGQLSSLAATNGCNNNLGSKKNGGPDLLLVWSPALDMENDGWFKRLLLVGKYSVINNSPLAMVKQNMPPVSIVQGELDILTPTLVAKKFCEKIVAGNGNCEINIYSGVGHLLTRNLKNQESDFDPKPEFVVDGNEKLMNFLVSNGFIKIQNINAFQPTQKPRG